MYIDFIMMLRIIVVLKAFVCFIFFFFFFNDTAPTEIYTLSLHDALPISNGLNPLLGNRDMPTPVLSFTIRDRKSTRLNSSHVRISYAVFCLKKKKNDKTSTQNRPD